MVGVGAGGLEAQRVKPIPRRETVFQRREWVSLKRKSRKHAYKLERGERKEGEREEMQLRGIIFIHMS